MTAKGVSVIEIEPHGAGHPEPGAVLSELARRGLTRVMIEGGGVVASSFLAAGLVDRIAWFHAPRIIGADGIPAVASIGIEKLKEAPSFFRTNVSEVAADVLEIYERVR